ncbi:hypothetical protein VC83_04430 [Pseudogymnoascus destructans]|uniref:tRNA(Ile)-lysidine synthetase n=2 Tax=Pseudogymnoascus destructans TaxID=655981 RepID=L8FZ83_PSED2|nr:uncharacterized protein VC83_04430 [Pseudogymnoascus destructans]ELR05793.1 hypothetical protein GMDG_01871 [Pseudogymnoascus destructans 20631-21]OAF59226.1 hypothetical protein VC83_04430 [Pseudogymnoascus destructans]
MVGVLHRTGWSGRGAAAISLDRFIASLRRLNHKGLNQLAEKTHGKPCNPLTIGLAISGGVDSMALAFLCSEIHNKDRFRFRAFVVDHKVRAGSGHEAHAVAKILEEKDIPTDILKIEWAEGLNPKEASNFESLARTYRFQALGKACRDHGIQSLFLAHHRDDQVETVLMRMINGHRKDGLCGMRLSGDIPECRGIYGVHQSGVVDDSASASQIKFGRGMDLTKSRSLDSSDDATFSLGMRIESGGIKVYRPLLCFSKQELRDTCEANGMSWFEDNTNADPTLTMRNAIRHIYANNKLPVALQKPSILALAKRLQENRDRDMERRNKSFAQKFRILKFEPSVPYCSVYFEPLDMGHNAKSSTEISSTEFEDASWWLRAVIQLISPVENIALGTLSTAVQRIYPELDSQVGHDPAPRKAFTVAGVMFEPAPSDMHDSLLSSHTSYNSTASEGSTLAPQQIANRHWIIRPQPYKRGKEPRLEFMPFQGKDEGAYWRDNDFWKLFDGRFWIRILNLTSTSISLRPFQVEDVHKLKRTEFMEQLEQREKLLLPLKTSEFRHVLPAIVTEVDGVEQVVGLPTLGIIAQDFEKLVKYEVRYRGLGSWPN